MKNTLGIFHGRWAQRIRQGANVNQPSEWDYEGVMTVGEITEPLPLKGFSDGNILPAFGTLDGFSAWLIFGNMEGSGVYVFNFFDETPYYTDKVEIDGVLFENGEPTEGTVFFTETDPFPAVGQTCTIKVKKGAVIEE